MGVIAKYKFNKNTNTNTIPQFNSGFIYTIEDETIDANIVLRTITSDNLPTLVKFGNTTANASTRSLTEVLYINTSNINDMSYMFTNCSNLTTVNTSDWNTSNVTTMNSMFFQCGALKSIDLSNCDLSKVTSMYGMFYMCKVMTSVVLGNTPTLKLQTTEGMFNNCQKLISIDFGGLDTNNINNMGGMFSDCRVLTELNINHWNVSKVTNFGAMFRRCYALTELNLSNWDTSAAGNMSTMFESCTSLLYVNVDNFDFSSVANLSGLFQNSNNIERIDMNNINLNSNKSVSRIFYACNNLKILNIKNTKAEYINVMISELPERTSDNICTLSIEGVDNDKLVDTAKANNKYWYFDINILIAEYKFNIGQDTLPNFNEGYTYEYIDTQNDDNTITRRIVNNHIPSSIHFVGCTGLKWVGYLRLEGVVALSSSFQGCSNLQLIDSSEWNTKSITAIDTTFHLCTSLTDIIGIENWDTSSFGLNTTRVLVGTFANCYSLTELNLYNWEINYKVSANSFFTECRNLHTIYLPKHFEIINILALFQNCSSLVNVYGLDKLFTLDNGSNRRVFEGCSSLEHISLVGLDASGVTRLDLMFSGCTSLKSVDLTGASINASAVLTPMFSNCNNLEYIKTDNPDVITTIVDELPPNNIKVLYDGPPLIGVDLPSNLTVCKPHLITEYVYVNTNDTIPNFNEGFSYCVSESYDIMADIVIRRIYSESIPTQLNFTNCTGLLDVVNIDLSNQNNLDGMFQGCTSLYNINLKNLKIGNIISMSDFFKGCTNLYRVNLSNWDLNDDVNVSNFFNGCENLGEVHMNNSDSNSINKIIEQLPTKPLDNKGALKILNMFGNSTNITLAMTKNWIIYDKIINNHIRSGSRIGFISNGQMIYEIKNGDETTQIY